MRKEDERLMDVHVVEPMTERNRAFKDLGRRFLEESESGVLDFSLDEATEKSIHVTNILFRTLHWTPTQFREEIYRLEQELQGR